MLQCNKPALSIQNNFATTSATSGTYVQLVASSAALGTAYQSGRLQYYNGSGVPVILAYGAAGSEQNWLCLPPTNNPVVIDALFPSSQRISVLAVKTSATSGYLTLDFLI